MKYSSKPCIQNNWVYCTWDTEIKRFGSTSGFRLCLLSGSCSLLTTAASVLQSLFECWLQLLIQSPHQGCLHCSLHHLNIESCFQYTPTSGTRCSYRCHESNLRQASFEDGAWHNVRYSMKPYDTHCRYQGRLENHTPCSANLEAHGASSGL